MEPNENPQEPKEEKPAEEEQKNTQTVDIETLIKVDVANQLMEMGFSKNVSQKACLFTNSVLEQAIEWIDQHQGDPDFEEPAKIEVSAEENKPKLSPEEAKERARELQKKAREMHIQKQKELEAEQEKNRVRSIKELQEAQRLAKETETRLYVERRKKEKMEAEQAKREMLMQLARDKEERFGKKFDPFSQKEVKKEYTKYENVEYYLKVIKTTIHPNIERDRFMNCYTTLRAILRNILKDVNNEKFKKVKMTNPNVQERIGNIPMAIKTLEELGFVTEGEFMVAKNIDTDLYNKTVDYLNSEIEKYE